MNVKGKVAVITGASSGIGEAVARLLSEKGARVVLAARSFDKLKALGKELPGSFAIKTDMTKEEDIKDLVKKTIEHFGTVDILVNNAGRGYDAFIEEIDLTTFKNLLSLDLEGPLIAIQQVLPFMKKQKSGAIVNVSSGTALMSLPGMGGYSSIKRALAGISMTANEELKNDGISVSVIYPYITDTNFEENTIKSKKVREQAQEDGDWDPKIDPPDLVAQKILEAIETGKPVVYAHDWMGKRI